ncbi:sigma-70 family RNA polymerase sigma factor [Subtercola frigoramans]|uniref:RNA polymerase sigma factor (Sigma-70 family) n=1 Tax=Subtercola frigoramans TaxID=120298 RepID=A0ABS2L2V2_9MICO|nr:sigma-70 family RNA polymerase sigma factor [Subtercola frigoramans]MBM7471428.1 RNA polymerase sigma factor (sigma-70 family) [Subtercola frigoramans]
MSSVVSSSPVGAHAIPDADNGPSDLDLVERTRRGDSRAYAELWNRHSRAGRTVARSYSSPDADDIVSESFAKVLQAIKNGGGPTTAFRPYLFSTIRNVAMQWKRGSIVDASDELDALADPHSEENETLLALDKSLTAQAFRSLPTRWQEALWYSEVEQLSASEMSPLLGMSPNAISALTFRAREGLRQAWIQAHLVRAADSECASVIEKLGSYTRGSLGQREARKIREHLGTCASCSIVDDEAREVGSRLTLVLLPLVAGISGALAYTVWLQGGSSASAAEAVPDPSDAVSATGSPAHAGTPGVRPLNGVHSLPPSVDGVGSAGFRGVRTWGGVALATAAAVAAIVVLVPLFSPTATSTTDSAPNSEHGAPSAKGSPGTFSLLAHSRSEAVAGRQAGTGVAASPGTPPVSAGEPLPAPTPAIRPVSPVRPVMPAVGIVDPVPGSPTPSPVPTSPATIPPVPPVIAAIPTFSFVVDPAGLVFPLLTGVAEPGAQVDVVDTGLPGGAVVASATADPITGAYAVSDYPALGFGPHQLAVRQTTSGVTSQLSASTAVTLATITLNSPTSGSSIMPSYFVEASGIPDGFFEELFNGVADPVTYAIGSDGHFLSQFTAPPLPDLSPATVGVRYIDPDTGQHGPLSSAAVIVTLTP